MVAEAMAEHHLSPCRACGLVGITRRALCPAPAEDRDRELRQQLRELAQERRRFGCRRLGWLLNREAHSMNHKKLYRLYCEERLMVRRRGRRKRALMELLRTLNQR